jgi:hypothetical protein
MISKHPRLVAPLVVTAAGTVIAIAVGIGHTWTGALVTEVVVILLSVGYYLLTRGKGDVGAIYGHRADERQRLVVMRASRLALIVMIGVAFCCAVIMVALNDNYWQADVIGTAGGLSYFLGLMIYGAHDDEATGSAWGIMASGGVAGVDGREGDSASK